MLDFANKSASDLADTKSLRSLSSMPSPSKPAASVAREVLTRGKKVKGRKRHILVDTLGLLLEADVTDAKTSDWDGARTILAQASFDLSRLKTIRVDTGYTQGDFRAWVFEKCGWVLEIIRKPAHQKGFAVLPKRWIVERTFAWLTSKRRLGKSFEILAESEIAFMQLSMIQLMAKRLA